MGLGGTDSESERSAPLERDENQRSSSTPSLPAGAPFADRFRIESLIGKGSMGRVYEAVDLQSGERVALKILQRDRTPEPETRERFRREAQILSTMDHPGVVGIRAFGYAADGTPWLAMELLEGETLLDRVRRKGPLSLQELLPIVSASCDALEAAHELGVVHRDLKPENIFIPAEGQAKAKILDFGLSLAIGGAKLTATGAVIGTPRYMAPEQIRSAHGSDARVDVYALGVILYEALAGTSPFAASDQGQLLGAIFTGSTTPLSQIRPDLPAELETVIRAAMTVDPDARLATPGALAVSLREVAAGRPSLTPPSMVSSTRAAGQEREGSSSPPPGRGRTWIIVAVLGGALLAGAVLAAAAVHVWMRLH